MKPGAHICCLAETRQHQRAILACFVKEGLKQGHKALLIRSGDPVNNLGRYLRLTGAAALAALQRGQVGQIVLQPAQTSEADLIALVQRELEAALGAGYLALRVAFDWPVETIRRAQFETRLNQLLAGAPCLALCLIDPSHSDPLAVAAAAPTHSHVLYKNQLYENYIQVAAPNPAGLSLPEIVLQHWLNALKTPAAGENGIQIAQQMFEQRLAEHLQQLAAASRDLEDEISRREQVEQALQEAENRYRVIANNTSDWEFWISPEGRFLYSSPSCQDLTGVAPIEFLEDPDVFFALIHPEDRARVAASLQQPPGQARAESIEFRLISRDGQERWIEHSSQPVYDHDGQYLGRRGANREITQRKLTETELFRHTARWQALAEASQKFYEAGQDLGVLLPMIVRQASESVGDGCILVLFTDHGQTAVPAATHHINPEAAIRLHELVPPVPFPTEQVGFFKNTLTNQPYQVVFPSPADIPGDALQRLAGFIDQYGLTAVMSVPLRSQQEVIGCLVVLRGASSGAVGGASGQTVGGASGAMYSLEDQAFLQGLADRAVLAIVNTRLISAMQQELAERQRAEAALRAGEERFRLISELTSDFAFALRLEPDGSLVQDWSMGALARMLEVPAPEIDIIQAMAFIFPEDRPIFQKWITQLLQGGPGATRELRLLTPQKNLRWVQVYVRPVWDRAGDKVTGLVGAGQDITQRRLAEEAERAQRAYSDALQEVAAIFSSTLDLQEVLDYTLDLVSRFIPFDAVNLMLVEEGVARVVALRGYEAHGQSSYLPDMRWKVSQTPNLAKMVTSGQALVVPDISQDANWITVEDEWLKSYVGAPIFAKGQAIGFLNLDSGTPRFFNQAHAERLLGFAQQAGVAIENARMFDEIQRYARHTALLSDITRQGVSAPNLQNMLQRIADRLGELFNADGAYITLWDPAQQIPVPAAGFGACREKFLTLKYLPGQPSITSAVLDLGRPLVIDNLFQSPYWNPQFTRDSTHQSLLGLPLVADERPLGSAVIYFRARHDFLPDDLVVGMQAAGQIALAVSKAQLLEAERQRAFELARSNALIAALSATSTRLETTSEPIKIMEVLGVELRQLGVNCLVVLVDQDKRDGVVQYISIEPTILTLIEKLVGFSLIGLRLPDSTWPLSRDRSRRALFKPHPLDLIINLSPQTPEPIMSRAARLAGIGPDIPLLIAPLSVHDQPIGVLSIWGSDLREDDTQVYSIFASQVAAALQNARLYKQVEQLAITDDLTNLYNRRGLFALGRHEVERALRLQRPLSVLMVDIDHFKQVNDTYGHPAGDQVLRALAEACRQNVRDIDVLARYGGEEFVILLVESDLQTAAQVAERLRENVYRTPFQTDKGSLTISVSVGVTAASLPSDTLEELIDQADQALYQAKQGGRNLVGICHGRPPSDMDGSSSIKTP